ncbi:hypothetical protein GCM10023311_16270 [Flaviramulus aquimarinus]|uniref:WG repeat-containing protein n=1 Tax=Flaviramulus aquimarinus TaxID=1170456 RepID=A0ABP9F4G6_9FLAO
MKKIVITLVLAVCSFQVGFSQEIDQKTLSKISMKMVIIESLNESGDFKKSLNSFDDLFELIGDNESVKIQILYIKTLYGFIKKDMKESKEKGIEEPIRFVIEELINCYYAIDKLNEMNVSQEDLKEIALISYEVDEMFVNSKEERLYNGRIRFSVKSRTTPGISLAKFEINGKYSYINKYGEVVLPPIYDDNSSQGFNEGVAAVILNKEFLIVNEKGDILKNLGKNLFGSPGVCYNGLIAVSANTGGVFINKKGVIVLKSFLLAPGDFTGALAPVQKVIEDRIKTGYIDENGRLVVPYQYDDGDNFYNNIAIVEKNDKYGIINIKGEELVAPKYDEIGIPDFEKYNLLTVEVNGKFGWIDKYGKLIIPIKYSYYGMPRFDDNGRAYVKDNTGYHHINTKGERID